MVIDKVGNASAIVIVMTYPSDSKVKKHTHIDIVFTFSKRKNHGGFFGGDVEGERAR